MDTYAGRLLRINLSSGSIVREPIDVELCRKFIGGRGFGISYLFREIQAENALAHCYAGLGRLHKQQGNAEQAREYLTKALEIFERLGTLIEPEKVRQELADLP